MLMVFHAFSVFDAPVLCYALLARHHDVTYSLGKTRVCREHMAKM
jgi:hypothetical protein